MKKGKIFFGLIMLFFIGATAMSKNNFNPSGWFGSDVDTISHTELHDFVRQELTVPMKECYADANPHVFMMKCYSDLFFELDEKDGMPVKYLYPDYPITGQVVFIDCGQRNHVASARIHYKKKKIEVRESFFGNWIDHKEYLTSFCAGIKEKEDGN